MNKATTADHTQHVERLRTNVPEELRAREQWLLYRLEWKPDKDKPDKVPYYASTGKRRNGKNGGPADRAKWATFDDACAAFLNGGYDGLGFAMASDAELTGVDEDDCIAADGTLSPLAQELVELTHTYTEISPSGTGLRFFLYGEGYDAKNHEVGVEVFYGNGFLTITGNRVNGADIMPLTPQIEARLRDLTSPSKTKKTKKTEKVAPEGYGVNGRNCKLTSVAGTLVNARYDEEDIKARLLDMNAKFDKPLPEREVETIARSSRNFEVATTLTDYGNAERLVIQHGENLRFITKARKWMVWDGQRWVIDEDGVSIMRMAKQVVRSIYKEAADADDADRRKALSQWGKLSEGSARLAALIGLAWSEPGIPIKPDELDANPLLLGVTNGVIDLRSGELVKPRRKDYITRSSLAEYQPGANCPVWLKFLDRIFGGDAALISFMQRAVGYSLTGNASEQCFFFLYGTGANGKSTFLKVLEKLLGNYATSSPPETFMQRKQGAATNDIARLHNVRVTTAIETEDGQHMAESLIKQLTGQDRISGRFLFAEFFDFEPVFKLWLAANHLPVIKGTDHAIWRRIKRVPFTVCIPDAEKDKALPEKLLAELPGILNWALEGCRAWQESGLAEPEAVTQATADYRRDMDVLQQFFDECCVIDHSAAAGSAELYATYKNWTSTNTGWAMSQTKLGRVLEERGFTKQRSKTGQRFLGIGLRANQAKGFGDESEM